VRNKLLWPWNVEAKIGVWKHHGNQSYAGTERRDMRKGNSLHSVEVKKESAENAAT